MFVEPHLPITKKIRGFAPRSPRDELERSLSTQGHARFDTRVQPILADVEYAESSIANACRDLSLSIPAENFVARYAGNTRSALHTPTSKPPKVHLLALEGVPKEAVSRPDGLRKSLHELVDRAF